MTQTNIRLSCPKCRRGIEPRKPITYKNGVKKLLYYCPACHIYAISDTTLTGNIIMNKKLQNLDVYLTPNEEYAHIIASEKKKKNSKKKEKNNKTVIQPKQKKVKKQPVKDAVTYYISKNSKKKFFYIDKIFDLPKNDHYDPIVKAIAISKTVSTSQAQSVRDTSSLINDISYFFISNIHGN